MHEAHTSLTLSCQIANARTHFPRRKNSLAVIPRPVNPTSRPIPITRFRLPLGADSKYISVNKGRKLSGFKPMLIGFSYAHGSSLCVTGSGK